jgi:hypothetical protein
MSERFFYFVFSPVASCTRSYSFGFGFVARSSSSRRRPIFNSSRARSALQRLLVRCPHFGSAPFPTQVLREARARRPSRRCLIYFRRLIFFYRPDRYPVFVFFTARTDTPFSSRPDWPVRQSVGPLARLKFFFARQCLRPICFLVVGRLERPGVDFCRRAREHSAICFCRRS